VIIIDIRGIQKITLIDYPGKVASTIFTMSCDFRCEYCHNPELVEKNEHTPEKISVDAIFKILEQRKKFIDGVVITGGEPCLQKDLAAFIERIKSLGLLVKLDTNGSHPEVLEELLSKGIVDYVAMDIKAPLDKYNEYAPDIDVKKIQQSIELVKKFPDYEFRTTISRHLSPEDVVRIAETISKAETAKKYFLQQMRFGKNLKKDLKLNLYTKHELEEICAKIKNLVYACGIRNL